MKTNSQVGTRQLSTSKHVRLNGIRYRRKYTWPLTSAPDGGTLFMATIGDYLRWANGGV